VSPPNQGAAAALLALLAGGCGDTFVVKEGEAGTPGGPGGTVSATGSGAATSGAAGAGGTVAAGGATGGAGGGAAPPACGNGVIEAGEQCDDGNDDAKDGCHACAVECLSGETLEPVSLHCYWAAAPKQSWLDGANACAQKKGDLAGFSTEAELDFVVALARGVSPLDPAWTGGNDLAVEGKWQWRNGEPWSDDFWAPTEPNTTGDEDCAALDVATVVGGLRDTECSDKRTPLCERHPPGKLP
jgi:cysteine-rich repeat protein